MVTVSIAIVPNIKQILIGSTPDWAYWNSPKSWCFIDGHSFHFHRTRYPANSERFDEFQNEVDVNCEQDAKNLRSRKAFFWRSPVDLVSSETNIVLKFRQ